MQSASTLTLAPAARVPIVVAGLLVTLLLAALDATIVATAMPSIATDLHGFDRYSWVTVAYLLTSTVSVPVVARLTDHYGRRVYLIGGALIFLTGSTLCALAGTFEQLVAFRLLQGIGAGTITATVFAAVPRLFAPSAGARLIGLFTGTYGLASIAGPLLGGVLTDDVGWRAIFWINVPIGLLGLLLVALTYPNDGIDEHTTRVDYAGAATLVGGLSPILLALLVGGRDVAWTSPIMFALLLGGAALLAVFVRIERHAEEPIIPIGDLTTRALGAPVVGSALMNAALIATLLFTPLFAQGVLGQSATQSGGVLVPMTTAWILASIVGGQLIARTGRTRWLGVAGMIIGTCGVWLIAGMGPGTPPVVLARNLVVVGIGLGAAVSAFVISAQNAVPVERVGVAVGLSTFARAIGATLATAGLGGLLSANVGGPATEAHDALALSIALGQTFLVASLLVALGTVAAMFIRDDAKLLV